ncbi:MAG: ubiquinol oxidase subunit II [Pseudomonadota bacterium]
MVTRSFGRTQLDIRRVATNFSRAARYSLLAILPIWLSGCDMVLLKPSGDIARQQSDLMVTSVYLMLLIVVPVIVATLYFAWHYRESNTDAEYTPEWDHSTQLEMFIWAIPLMIIIALGAMTWITTHTLDPFRPLSRIGPDKPIGADTEPLEIQAIALEWKWLFIYPQHGIAVVNEVAAPIDVPIRFHNTSPRMMNSLFIPSLAGMIYAMPGMETQLNAVINEPGDYYGVSGNYSGEGYSDMRFRFHGHDQDGFDAWVEAARASGETLDAATYLKLAEPSIKHPVQRFSRVQPDLYRRILNLCVEAGKVCMDDMHSGAGAHHESGH